jgi:hypothetical protein
MGLLREIEDQQSFQFSGKINFLSAQSSQMRGFLSLLDGELHSCFFNRQVGKKALFNAVLSEIQHNNLRYVVEPEIIKGSPQNLFMDLEQFRATFSKLLERHQKSKKLRPPENLKLKASASFIQEGAMLTGQEFDLLATISDFQVVSDIYREVNLYEHETTESLIGLRKKGAIRVIASQ